MANKVVKFLAETYGKQTLVDSLKAGGWKAAIDGSLAQTALIHGPGGTLRGVDRHGNKYYERMTENFGRHRWVVYSDLDFKTGQDPTTIPPEWHGWINHVTDATPNDTEFSKPIYYVTSLPAKSNSPECYLPKGAWRNPHKRNWTKVQAWQPPQQA